VSARIAQWRSLSAATETFGLASQLETISTARAGVSGRLQTAGFVAIRAKAMSVTRGNPTASSPDKTAST